MRKETAILMCSGLNGADSGVLVLCWDRGAEAMCGSVRFDELVKRFKVEYHAGGSTQNSVKVAQAAYKAQICIAVTPETLAGYSSDTGIPEQMPNFETGPDCNLGWLVFSVGKETAILTYDSRPQQWPSGLSSDAVILGMSAMLFMNCVALRLLCHDVASEGQYQIANTCPGLQQPVNDNVN
eukprot:g48514.t1